MVDTTTTLFALTKQTIGGNSNTWGEILNTNFDIIDEALGNTSPVAGGFRNLVIQNNSGTPNTQIDLDASAVTVETSGGLAYRLRSVDLTINAATTGANALDTGALAADTWYYSYVIYKPSTGTVAGLLSLSATSPTLPSLYTAYARFGSHRTDASGVLHRTLQKNTNVQYVLSASVTTVLPLISSAAVGTYSEATPTYAATSVSDFVPPSASRIRLVVTNSAAGSGNYSAVMVAPNTSYSGATSTKCPPIFVPSTTAVVVAHGEFTLESTNIALVTSGSFGRVSCLGWEENI